MLVLRWGSAGLLTLAMLIVILSLGLVLLPTAGLAPASAIDGTRWKVVPQLGGTR